jgi:hypothetical protein
MAVIISTAATQTADMTSRWIKPPLPRRKRASHTRNRTAIRIFNAMPSTIIAEDARLAPVF